MAMIIVCGDSLYYTRPMKGEDGPLLLLIHGAGGTHLDWPKEIQRLPGTAVYNLDLPGHGRSIGKGRSSIEKYADVVQGFIEALSLQDVTIIGHSMGGAIALTLTLRSLTQLSHMIIIGSSAKLRVSPDLLEGSLSNPEQAVDYITRSSWGSDADTALARQGKRSMMQSNIGVLRDDLVACDRFDVRTKLHQINVPTLIISGTEDKMTPIKFGRFLAKNIHGAQMIEIEEAGHFPMLQKPAVVAAAIAQFLGIKGDDPLD